jgi:hypothetical protein
MDPAHSRVYFEFYDDNLGTPGNICGSSNTAVTAQQLQLMTDPPRRLATCVHRAVARKTH